MSKLSESRGVAFTDVMNVHVFNGPNCQDLANWKSKSAKEIYDLVKANSSEEIAYIDHLTVANLNTEGPSNEIKGGLYNNTLIKTGKTCRGEFTDALAETSALEAMGLITVDSDGSWIISQNFATPKLLIGDTVVASRNSGEMIPVHVIIFQFLADAVPSFAFEAGNNATIDMNGDVLCTTIKNGSGTIGAFWALIDDESPLPTGSCTDTALYGN